MLSEDRTPKFSLAQVSGSVYPLLHASFSHCPSLRLAIYSSRSVSLFVSLSVSLSLCRNNTIDDYLQKTQVAEIRKANAALVGSPVACQPLPEAAAVSSNRQSLPVG